MRCQCGNTHAASSHCVARILLNQRCVIFFNGTHGWKQYVWESWRVKEMIRHPIRSEVEEEEWLRFSVCIIKLNENWLWPFTPRKMIMNLNIVVGHYARGENGAARALRTNKKRMFVRPLELTETISRMGRKVPNKRNNNILYVIWVASGAGTCH